MGLGIALLSCSGHLRAQEISLSDFPGRTPRAALNASLKSSIPEAPIVKLDLVKPRFLTKFKFDRPVLFLAAIQGSAEFYDGYTTKRSIADGYQEDNPLSRMLLGKRPTWTGMTLFGSLEDVGAAYLHQRMRHSRYKFVRLFAPALPLTLITIHIVAGSKNLQHQYDICRSNLGPHYVLGPDHIQCIYLPVPLDASLLSPSR